ncbi:MAG: regulatory iron-sulfur-containing complex subunit RicT [Alistipes sp.]
MDCDKQNKACCKAEVGRGCTFCNATCEPTAELTDGCFKLHETAWLEEYPDNVPTDIFEIRFKNTRRGFYQNANNLPLKRGDIVAVEASPGHDIGIISLTGDMVAKQMRRTGFNPLNGEFKKIYRLAKPYDIERWQEAIEMEHETMILSRQIAAEMGLNMKIGDVEYQGDKVKAIFYYIADERVDFRELIKVFAERFHIRIEMKQIGARQEAGRIGGLGACGRELCCASWIASFTSVTTGAARTQDISLNPQKLAGQCSKLKCCMMYEYDTYVDARKDFPRLREPLQTLDGEFFLFKSDVLGGTMSFSTSKDAICNVVTLPIARVKEIVALNRAGKKVERLLEIAEVTEVVEEPTYRSEEDSITRFDQSKRRKNRRGGRGREDQENRPRGENNKASDNVAPQAATEQKPREQRSREPKAAGATPNAGGENRENRGNRGGRGGRDSRNNNSRGARPERAERAEGAQAPRATAAPKTEAPKATVSTAVPTSTSGEPTKPTTGERREGSHRGGRNRGRGRGNGGGQNGGASSGTKENKNNSGSRNEGAPKTE